MRTRLLFLLASLLPGGFLFSQHPEGIWQVDSINLEDVKGPYISVLMLSTTQGDAKSQTTYSVYRALVSLGDSEKGLLEQNSSRLMRADRYLRDENNEKVAFNNWTDALNKFHQRGWKLVGVVPPISGGEPLYSTTNPPWFILEKMPRP